MQARLSRTFALTLVLALLVAVTVQLISPPQLRSVGAASIAQTAQDDETDGLGIGLAPLTAPVVVVVAVALLVVALSLWVPGSAAVPSTRRSRAPPSS